MEPKLVWSHKKVVEHLMRMETSLISLRSFLKSLEEYESSTAELQATSAANIRSAAQLLSPRCRLALSQVGVGGPLGDRNGEMAENELARVSLEGGLGKIKEIRGKATSLELRKAQLSQAELKEFAEGLKADLLGLQEVRRTIIVQKAVSVQKRNARLLEALTVRAQKGV